MSTFTESVVEQAALPPGTQTSSTASLHLVPPRPPIPHPSARLLTANAGQSRVPARVCRSVARADNRARGSCTDSLAPPHRPSGEGRSGLRGYPHLFDSLGTADRRREREVERALVDHIQRFLPGPAYGIAARSRGSSTKLQVLNTALMAEDRRDGTVLR